MRRLIFGFSRMFERRIRDANFIVPPGRIGSDVNRQQTGRNRCEIEGCYFASSIQRLDHCRISCLRQCKRNRRDFNFVTKVKRERQRDGYRRGRTSNRRGSSNCRNQTRSSASAETTSSSSSRFDLFHSFVRQHHLGANEMWGDDPFSDGRFIGLDWNARGEWAVGEMTFR